ncbi:flagellar hook-length control protein FliK [Aliiroseovarius crassostreae]|uniref:flagellar hook-length control protein FliK n=1 Tax=Aliiroseovarius crassostreae TaxID=154981 RepID=UPI003C7C8C1F
MQLGSSFPLVGGTEKTSTKADTADTSLEGDVSFGDVVLQSHENAPQDEQANMLPMVGPEGIQVELPRAGEGFGRASTNIAADAHVANDADASDQPLRISGNETLGDVRIPAEATIAEATIKGQLSGQAADVPAALNSGAAVVKSTSVDANVPSDKPSVPQEQMNVPTAKMRSAAVAETPGDFLSQSKSAASVSKTEMAVPVQLSKVPIAYQGSAKSGEEISLSAKDLVAALHKDEGYLRAEGPPASPKLAPENSNSANLGAISKPLSGGAAVQTVSLGDPHGDVDATPQDTPEGEEPKTTPAVQAPGSFIPGAKNQTGTPSLASIQAVQDFSDANQVSEMSSGIDVVTELAANDVRAAETLLARAEISGHLRAELPRHIAVQLADVARLQPDRPVELTLSPEELGRLRLTFSGDMSAMTVSVNVERPETLDLMRRHIDLLAQEMRDIGYGEVSFSFEQSGADTGGTSDDTSSGTGMSSGDTTEEDNISSLAATPLQLNLSDHTGVDIRL